MISLLDEDGALDLNHARTEERAERIAQSNDIVHRIDAVISVAGRLAAIEAIVADIALNPPDPSQRPGRSVSASAVGDECSRRVQLNIWESFHPDQPAPQAAPFDAKTLAIFERGHRTERAMAEWMLDAGFDLVTHYATDDGLQQYGFIAADGQVKGFADGIIHINTPGEMLWENKTVGDKNWRGFVAKGFVEQSPRYDAQVQLLMGYMAANRALVTILNADTGDIYAEVVAFNQPRSQKTSDHAVDILRATRANDLLPRCASGPDVFPCKQCTRFRATCWEV